MLDSKEIMKFKSYQNQANLFVKEYLLADPLIPYTSIIGGIFACKMVCCIALCCYSYSIFCSTFPKVTTINLFDSIAKYSILLGLRSHSTF